MKPGIKFSLASGVLGILAACTAQSPVTPQVKATIPPERLFLQQVSARSAIVKWRGGDATQACFSTRMKDLDGGDDQTCVDGVKTAGHHLEAQLTGLLPDKTYFYSIGGMTGPDQQFRTAPGGNTPPADGNTHILIVGDSGTATETAMLPPLGDGVTLQHAGEAAEVLAGFETYNTANGNERVDLFLALGDNAYNAGTDAQWQGAFFDVYPGILKGAGVLPTIGNHEMGYAGVSGCKADPRLPCEARLVIEGTSTATDPASYDGNGDEIADESGLPYLDIFSLPTRSGTEQYYSVDYGNVHIVSLDSQLSARDDTARAAMKQWLISDLAANTRDWTIVIFHHPPFSKGNNHDSDDAQDSAFSIDKPQFDMRVEFTPVFEDYGVDVVYSGHSHSYERSYYLHGFRGTSASFDPARHAEINNDRQPALGYGGNTYAQVSPTSGNVDDRVVYTVAGSSGKADSADAHMRTVTSEDWLRHRAHVPQPADDACGSAAGCRNGLALKGSVVLDASASALSAKFVDVKGNVLDQFTITR